MRCAVRVRILIAIVAAAVLAAAPAARADIYQRVLAAYERYGSVAPCRFSSAQLEAALRGVDTYGEQYFADFTNAVQNALAARASGACIARSRRRVLASGGVPPTVPATLPASPTAVGTGGVPGPLALMGILVLLGAGALVLMKLAAERGWEPGWAAAWRHAADEAGYRIAARFDALEERLRIRRRRSRP